MLHVSQPDPWPKVATALPHSGELFALLGMGVAGLLTLSYPKDSHSMYGMLTYIEP